MIQFRIMRALYSRYYYGHMFLLVIGLKPNNDLQNHPPRATRRGMMLVPQEGHPHVPTLQYPKSHACRVYNVINTPSIIFTIKLHACVLLCLSYSYNNLQLIIVLNNTVDTPWHNWPPCRPLYPGTESYLWARAIKTQAFSIFTEISTFLFYTRGHDIMQSQNLSWGC